MRPALCRLAVTAILASSALADDAAADIVAEPVSDAASGVSRAPFEPYAYSGSAFVEQFIELDESRWSASRAQKATPVGGETFSYVGKWQVQEPTVFPGLVGDKGLVVTSQAAHHAISASLDSPLDPGADDVVVQYEVKLQKGLECGGAYIKLLSESEQGVQAQEFSDKTEYSIMFGPDKCGSTNKVHLILRHKSPKTGEVEEKHLKAPPSPRISKTTALYTLHLSPSDSSYEIFINGDSAKKGSLLSDDFSPKFTPDEEIDDADDKKPEDWVDAAKITDPDATKPDDWDEDAPMEIPDEDATMPEGWLEDEPATVPDPEAEKPEEWDEEEDGDWVAPSIPNPKCEDAPGCGPWIRPTKSNPAYKGQWYAPLIDNPLYKGVWKAARVLNPAYYEEKAPLSNIGRIAAVGFEIWSMQSDILFDNIYIGTSLKEAQAFAKATYHVKKPIEDAEEKATMPEDAHKHSETPSSLSFKSDPIGFARSKLLGFIDLAREDPVFALKSQPQTAAVVGGGLLTLLGMISAVLGLLAPKAPVVKKKASEGAAAAKSKINATANAVADSSAGAQIKDAANNAKEATTSAVDDASAAIKKRTAGKGKATEL